MVETAGAIEILPWECGKKWIVVQSFTIEFEGHKLTVPKGMVYDRYTFAPNLPDNRPAAAHDVAYGTKKWDDGTPIDFLQANRMIRYLMSISWSRLTRCFARLYQWGLNVGGLYAWYHSTPPVILDEVTTNTARSEYDKRPDCDNAVSK